MNHLDENHNMATRRFAWCAKDRESSVHGAAKGRFSGEGIEHSPPYLRTIRTKDPVLHPCQPRLSSLRVESSPRTINPPPSKNECGLGLTIQGLGFSP